MSRSTDHHYTIAAERAGVIATRSGVLTLEPIATRAGVIDYLLKQMTRQHGPGLRVTHFDIKPNLR